MSQLPLHSLPLPVVEAPAPRPRPLSVPLHLTHESRHLLQRLLDTEPTMLGIRLGVLPDDSLGKGGEDRAGVVGYGYA